MNLLCCRRAANDGLPANPPQNNLCHYVKLEGRRVLQIFAATAASSLATLTHFASVLSNREQAGAALFAGTIASLSYIATTVPFTVYAALAKGALNTIESFSNIRFTCNRDTAHKCFTALALCITASVIFTSMALSIPSYTGENCSLFSMWPLIPKTIFTTSCPEPIVDLSKLAGTVHLIGSAVGYVLLRQVGALMNLNGR